MASDKASEGGAGAPARDRASQSNAASAADARNVAAVRRQRHDRWRAAGGAFDNSFRRTHEAGQLHRDHADRSKAQLAAEPVAVAVAGRVMLRRVLGKASFLTLQDETGAIQCYLSEKELGEAAYAAFQDLWDIGDLVGLQGSLMRTNRGELTVAAESVVLLNKSLRPLPEKFHGLADTETRYRQRYLDLMMNQAARSRFAHRSRIVSSLRGFFEDRGFLEVETPMMHLIPGGANAAPFVTHHNALDLPLYLRVAPELFLKRLVVGGFERVFEINRNFRNEGLSTRHNPEFTMLEFYWAYHDYRDLMALTETLLAEISQTLLGDTAFSYQGLALDFGKPFERLTLAQAIQRHSGLASAELDDEAYLRKRLADRHGKDRDLRTAGLGALQMALFEAEAEPELQAPTFITDYPAEVSPLSRRNDANPFLADRFELFVAGREIANGFSELNDPHDQAERFRRQAAQKQAGDIEAMQLDDAYLDALEYGLPPTAGEGIGVDRLVMLLTDAPSIRDVLLFPLMRPHR